MKPLRISRNRRASTILKNCLVHDRTRSLLGQAKRKGLCLTCDFKPSPCWKSFARDQVCDFYQTRNNQSQLFQVGSQWQLDTFNFGSKLCCHMHALFVVCPAIRNQERVAHRIYSLKTRKPSQGSSEKRSRAMSGWQSTHRLLSSSFLGLPYRILNINHKKNYL